MDRFCARRRPPVWARRWLLVGSLHSVSADSDLAGLERAELLLFRPSHRSAALRPASPLNQPRGQSGGAASQRGVSRSVWSAERAQEEGDGNKALSRGPLQGARVAAALRRDSPPSLRGGHPNVEAAGAWNPLGRAKERRRSGAALHLGDGVGFAERPRGRGIRERAPRPGKRTPSGISISLAAAQASVYRWRLLVQLEGSRWLLQLLRFSGPVLCGGRLQTEARLAGFLEVQQRPVSPTELGF